MYEDSKGHYGEGRRKIPFCYCDLCGMSGSLRSLQHGTASTMVLSEGVIRCADRAGCKYRMAVQQSQAWTWVKWNAKRASN